METKEWSKIGFIYLLVAIITSAINMYNGYSLTNFLVPTLLSVVIFVTVVLVSMYFVRKLNTWVQIILAYVLSFIFGVLFNVIQGYSYDQYIKSVVYGTGMFVTMTLGLFYIFQVKFKK